MSKKSKEDFEIIETKVRRTEHPNTWKYPGRSGNEHKMALIKYMPKLTREQFKSLTDGTLVANVEATETFMKSLMVGDVIGVKDTLYVVQEVLPTVVKGYLKAEFDKTENPMELNIADITMAQIDFGLATGFAEILWRDGVPFGVEAEQDVKILVHKAKPAKSSKKKKDNKEKENV